MQHGGLWVCAVVNRPDALILLQGRYDFMRLALKWREPPYLKLSSLTGVSPYPNLGDILVILPLFGKTLRTSPAPETPVGLAKAFTVTESFLNCLVLLPFIFYLENQSVKNWIWKVPNHVPYMSLKSFFSNLIYSNMLSLQHTSKYLRPEFHSLRM